MKILATFFLAAIVGCYGYETCLEEKAGNCVDKLLTSLVDDSSEQEICSELQNSIGCLEDGVESCPGAEEDEDMKEGLDSLRELRNTNCQINELSPEEDEEIKKCFEENEDYVFECMFEGTAAALDALGDDFENEDENVLRCGLYGLLTGCFVDRIHERCGIQAAKLAEEELSDLPDEIKEACEAVKDNDVPEFKLLDDDKRRKK